MVSLALIILVAVVGCVVTIGSAVRIIKLTRRGAPREPIIGYFAVMLGVTVLVVGAIRLLA